MFDDVVKSVNVVATLHDEPRGKAVRRDWVLDDQGREWLLKKVSPGEAFAEFVGYALAGLLGLPVPSAGSTGVEGVWLSERVPDVTMWDPSSLDKLVNAPDLGKMLVLDALLAVGDRHANNVLVQYLSDDRAFLWLIDYDGSGLREPESMVDARGALPTLGHIKGLPSEVRGWANEAVKVLRRRADTNLLVGLRVAAEAYFPSVDIELADHVLRERLQNLAEIVSAHLDSVLS